MEQQSSTMIPQQPSPPQETSDITRLSYGGDVASIFKIWIVNILFSIITLGIYKFWGKTNIRRYLARSLSVAGERFEYTGTGRELMKGFGLAIPIIIGLIVISVVAESMPFLNILYFILFIVLFQIAIYGSMRYKFSRTRWKGIRTRLTGKRLDYAKLSIVRTIINFFTLGWKIPESEQKLWGFIINNGYFGTQKMHFTPNVDGTLKKLNLITILLSIPTFGMSRVWYNAESLNRKYNGTSLGDINIQSNFTGKNHFMHIFGNLAILIITIGFGTPLIIHRNMNYLARHITIRGNLNTDHIKQTQKQAASMGEGLDDMLDIDTDMDVGSFL